MCAAGNAGSGNFRTQAHFADVKCEKLRRVLDCNGIKAECLIHRDDRSPGNAAAGGYWAKAKPLLENLRQE